MRSGIASDYLNRWRRLARPAQLYLIHMALLTFSLSISGLFFNLAILALGYDRAFLGSLNGASIRAAVALSLPLWWLVTRIGLRVSMLASGLLQAASVFIYALYPEPTPLLIAVTLSGASAVMFQVSSPPFMMRHSDSGTRDHLFSANTGIAIGVAGIGNLLAGGLPALFGPLLGVASESALAYRATFAVAGAGVVVSLLPLLLIRDEARAGDKESGKQGERETRQEARAREQEQEKVSQNRLLDRIPEPYRAMVQRPWPLLMLLISPFFISWGAALLIPYLNLFFKEQFDVADGTLGLIFAALNMTTGLAALAGPLLSTRIGKIQAVALTQALAMPFLLALGFVPLLGVAVGAALARGALFNMGAPLYEAFAMERTDERARPVVIGIISGARTAGYIVAPEISVWVQSAYGFQPLFVATAICYGLATLANIVFFVLPARRRGT